MCIRDSSEWIASCTSSRLPLQANELTAIFNAIDADHSGSLSVDELTQSLGAAMKEAEAKLPFCVRWSAGRSRPKRQMGLISRYGAMTSSARMMESLG